ncbi:NARE ribosyltransferase, partial [Hippolais icterina]|nr:NARE ribosyltransferase [Hippolais icterina]
LFSMALPAHTLALLAMASVATATIQVNMDMAQHSFDDQYLQCSAKMTKNLPELQRLDFHNNEKFAKNWTMATAEWQKRGSISSPLSPDQAIALMAYTMNFTKLYKPFNTAMRTAGYSSDKYRHEFPFKSLHFLLTQALQKLKPDKCQDVYRGVRGVKFNTMVGMKVRFGQFASTSLSETVAQGYGLDTVFKVRTCHGADIQKFSYDQSEKEVLIPPF